MCPLANLQPTSSPYSADLLRPHDRELAWVKEFGTNTTEDVGDAFETNFASTGDPLALVEARFGTLAISTMSIASDTVPKGRSFLIPPWSTYKDAPVLGVPGLKMIVIYAHMYLFQEADDSAGTNNSAGFILSTEDLIGTAPTEPFMQFNIKPVAPIVLGVRPEHNLQMEEWNIGGAGMNPNPFVVNPAWGSNLYFQVITIGDGVKFASCICSISRDGITWTNVGTFGFPGVLRRVGLSITGREIAGLDWVRIYNYPAITADNIFEPPPPATGSRLFTP